MNVLPFIALFVPLAAAVLITVGFQKAKGQAVFLSIGACLISFLCALLMFFLPPEKSSILLEWMKLPGLSIQIGAMTDMLARTMLLTVTGVGLLIHIFAYGYMKEDKALERFFAELSLFMFSMIGIVLASNLVMMFIFWELVGLSSYLLIGFWFERNAAADAAKKAFIVNRIGDFGFLIGILMVWQLWHSVSFPQLETMVEAYPIQGTMATLAAVGLFCGCVGKSAQFPLHVWLPDAMEGPTPVSALIHAATMVAAGVYMLCRVAFILEMSPEAMNLIAFTGAFTALFAALIATQQNDIKRVLAYSTLSQLGYMVMAVGLAAYSAAMFHLTTHAFFKALLFLGAGSVIHALHHQQDIWQMGGLRKKMPATFITFMVGSAALAGVPLLSGFYSKEAILAAAYETKPLYFFVGVFTAGLTAYYMMRLCLVTFFGEARGKEVAHAHESSPVMTWPLMFLAVLSITGGWVGIDLLFSEIAPYHPGAHHHHDPEHVVLGASLLALLIGLGLGWTLYRGAKEEPVRIDSLRNKFYSDEIYDSTVVAAQRFLAAVANWTDRWVVEGLVRLAAISGTIGGEVLRLVQGGNLKAYIVAFILGVLILFYRLILFS